MGSETDPLQFDRAEPVQPSAGCEFCSGPLGESYYTAGGKKACETCRTGLLGALAAGKGAGSLLVALLLGGVMAVVGGLVWYGIRKISGYDIGLIAIAVGYGVGMAVRKGSGGWGGLRFQLLALALTYFGIAVSMAPYLLLDREAAVQPLVLLGVFLSVPVMIGQASPMMILIMGFGLWEAWKLNRRTELELAGPFRVAGPGVPGGP